MTKPSPSGPRRRARTIMVQGTMSGAGKSLVVAGLCRIFSQDGLTVAPFKSQNMALNSFVTAEGLEMGRAQVVQAEAAGVEPEVAMNPILLKPTTDVGSQVIVMGKPLGNMAARSYFAYKHELVPTVEAAFDSLTQRFDVVVIEGAGSPAEINLKSRDIVNMGMAKMAHAPVILVGDVDCGGVFAQLVGTHVLLDDDERPYVKALVVNKFRGDKTILDPGLVELERRLGVPVAGVVPYMDVDIEEEDGFSGMKGKSGPTQAIDVAVARLPHISNFTDFAALECLEGISVRYVASACDLGQPDLVIVPGTKSTLADLRWMHESGMGGKIARLAGSGTPVMGICGGYQMLGLEVVDEEGSEGGGSVPGLKLLPARTAFRPEKHLTRDRGRVANLGGPLAGLSGADIEGYQIHMGRTTLEGGSPFCSLCDKSGRTADDGCAQGNVYGTYLHGIFDSPDVCRRLVAALAQRRGIDAGDIRIPDRQTYKQEQYDRLADALRANLDMDLIYRILEEGM